MTTEDAQIAPAPLGPIERARAPDRRTAARETTVAQHHEHMRKLRKLDDARMPARAPRQPHRPQFGAERRHDQVQRFRDEPIEREDSRDG